jgi:hypothetical protein
MAVPLDCDRLRNTQLSTKGLAREAESMFCPLAQSCLGICLRPVVETNRRTSKSPTDGTSAVDRFLNRAEKTVKIQTG